jgi:hypothetical protein
MRKTPGHRRRKLDMKTFILIALIIFTFALSVVAQHNPVAKPLNLNVKGVTYDTTYASVLKLLGKPVKEESTKEYSTECMDKPAMFRSMVYNGMEIGLLGDIRGRRLKVYSIEITSAKWKTSGITLGASEADVTAKFGKPRLRVTNDETADVTYEYDMLKGYGATTFYFHKNKLIRIAMAEAIC